ncbi:MAG: RnfABCDGE type electron transport complex subunit D [Christensenellales bacterium]|jgi:electron transport complex protein RnfD|nr:RnfABCDGE type electron transport complex subunit D [Clostridiales bacterium]
MKKLLVSPSPHIGSSMTTRKVMLNVIIALLPSCVAGIFIFGLPSLVVLAVSTGSCVLAEFLYNLITKKSQTINDLSAVVTGLLLGMNMPPAIPLYIPVIGSFFAIMVVKMLFGGLGKNFANPALTARIFCVLAWTSAMTTFVKPIDYNNGFWAAMTEYFPQMFGAVDAVTSATPLGVIKSGLSGGGGNISVLNMLIGYTGGCIGEVSAIALILGGVYLIARNIIDWKIPVIYILTTALFSLIFYDKGYMYVLPSILGGGLLIGAFFMATDYATSPNTSLGVIIYAFGCGLLTVIIRRFGGYPEGVSFAILLMNLVTPLLDKYIKPEPFGAPRKKLRPKKEAGK